MDIGSFNVFGLLSKSLVRPNFLLFDTAGIDYDAYWTPPEGVREVSVIIQAAGGGGSETSGACGGAGATKIIRRMPVMPGKRIYCLFWDFGSSNWLPGIAVGGAYGAGATHGVNGQPQAIGHANRAEPPFTSLIIARPGQGGQSGGVSGAGGGITNDVTVGGGKAGVSAAHGLDVNAQTEWLDKLDDTVIVVPGSSGASGSLRGGCNIFGAGGGSGVNGGGGGASVYGDGGSGTSPAGQPGIYGGGGSKTGKGGDGFVMFMWEGKKA